MKFLGVETDGNLDFLLQRELLWPTPLLLREVSQTQELETDLDVANLWSHPWILKEY